MSVSEAPVVNQRWGWTATSFLTAILVAPLAYQVAILMFPTSSLAGIPVPVLLLLGILVWMIAAWAKCPPSGRWGALATTFFVLGLALWAYTAIGGAIQGATLVGATIAVPVALLLLLLRRPDEYSIWRASDAFAWAFVGACPSSSFSRSWAWCPPGTRCTRSTSWTWPPWTGPTTGSPFTDLLGLDGRWGGPLRHPNPTGGVAAVLLVYGFMRPPVKNLVFSGTGVLVLLLTCSRSAYAAAALGLVVIAVLPGWRVQPWWRPTARRIVALGIGVALGLRVVWWVQADPGLMGRGQMWPDFLSLWPQSRVFGVGEAAIIRAVEAGDLPPWATHGHNLYIDTLVRYGIVGVAVTVVLLGVVTVLAFGRLRRGPRRAARDAHGAGDHDRRGDRVRLAVPDGADLHPPDHPAAVDRRDGWTRAARRRSGSRAARSACGRWHDPVRGCPPRQPAAPRDRPGRRDPPLRRADRLPDGLGVRARVPERPGRRARADPRDPRPRRAPPLHPRLPRCEPGQPVRHPRQRRLPRDQGHDTGAVHVHPAGHEGRSPTAPAPEEADRGGAHPGRRRRPCTARRRWGAAGVEHPAAARRRAADDPGLGGEGATRGPRRRRHRLRRVRRRADHRHRPVRLPARGAARRRRGPARFL